MRRTAPRFDETCGSQKTRLVSTGPHHPQRVAGTMSAPHIPCGSDKTVKGGHRGSRRAERRLAHVSAPGRFVSQLPASGEVRTNFGLAGRCDVSG